MKKAYGAVKIQCEKCKQLGECVTVRARITGTATRYRNFLEWWCKQCRKDNHGNYKLAGDR